MAFFAGSRRLKPFFVTEAFASYTPGPNNSTPTTLKVLPIAAGTTRHLIAYAYFAGGSAAAPEGSTMHMLATAERTSGGVLSFADPTVIASESIELHLHWEADGGLPALRFHHHGPGDPQPRHLRTGQARRLPASTARSIGWPQTSSPSRVGRSARPGRRLAARPGGAGLAHPRSARRLGPRGIQRSPRAGPGPRPASRRGPASVAAS